METEQNTPTVEPLDLDGLELYCEGLRQMRIEYSKRIEKIDATLARIQKAGTVASKSTSTALPHPNERRSR